MLKHSIFLALHYIFYVILLQFLVKAYSFKEIIVNAMLIKIIIVLIMFPKSFITKIDFNYLLLILFSINFIFGNYIWFIATKNNMNLGKLDGIAISFYLPIVTLLLYVFFNQKIKKINCFGIIILGIGAYLTLL